MSSFLEENIARLKRSVEAFDKYSSEKMAQLDFEMIQLREFERELGKYAEIALYHDKCDYILSDELRYTTGFEMREIDVRDFFDRIFNREWMQESQNYEAYEFECIKSREYNTWKDRHDKGEEVDYKNEYTKWRYNPIVLYIDSYSEKKNGKGKQEYERSRARHKIILKEDEEAMKFVEGRLFAIASPITYVGRRRDTENARYIYAIALDLDGVGKRELENVFHQMIHKTPNDKGSSHVPVANIIVNSGHGLHLYYILEKPVPMYRENIALLDKLKMYLTLQIWNEFTSSVKSQIQPISQGFRLPGSMTKFSVPIRAFENTHAKYFSIKDLNPFAGNILKEEEVEKLDLGTRIPSRMTLNGAKEAYPEWYERFVVGHVKYRNKWHIHRGLYDWWLSRIRGDDPDRFTDRVEVGHRYYCLFMLAVYAQKCDIDYDELKKDAYSLLKPFDELSKSNDEKDRFTVNDVKAALRGYRAKYKTTSKDKIEYRTGLKMPVTRRNGRKQDVHLNRARLLQNVDYPDGKWREGNGRKKGSKVSASKSPAAKVVKEWQKANPNGTKTQCASDSGLDRKTVAKWWGSELSPQNLVLKWKITHPGNENKSQCAKDTGLSRPTVIKWWE